MEHKNFFLLITFLANCMCSVQITTKSLANVTSQHECLKLEDCPSNTICQAGRSKKRRCTDCIDCQNFRRFQGLNTRTHCATHQTECASCFPGYEEAGGVCIPTSYTSNNMMTDHNTGVLGLLVGLALVIVFTIGALILQLCLKNSSPTAEQDEDVQEEQHGIGEINGTDNELPGNYFMQNGYSEHATFFEYVQETYK